MSILEGRRVLITGGTGSFGKKCVEMLLRDHSPSRLVIFSRDEQKQVDMARNLFPPSRFPQIRYFIGDVRDASRLRRALSGMDFVIHAAAMKHVDVAEYNPQECIRTNVGGAENLIDACIDCGVEKLVALSTDKAVNPVNLYGATKLCSDKLFVAGNALAGSEKPRFSVVRYGNVLGSKGSVVPFFQREKSKGVLPITDPRMTRFIITLEQGVQFVFRAFEQMEGGEVFVPKIPSTTIMELAKAIGPTCRTEVVGIRPGEKLHECMVPLDEARHTVEFEDYYVIEPVLNSFSRKSKLDQPGTVRCADGFSYSSDTNQKWLTVEQLRAMIRDHCGELHEPGRPSLRIAG